jgi:hypothetical protein
MWLTARRWASAWPQKRCAVCSVRLVGCIPSFILRLQLGRMGWLNSCGGENYE